MSSAEPIHDTSIDDGRERRFRLERVRSRISHKFEDHRELRLTPQEVITLVEVGVLEILEKELTIEREKECERRNSIKEMNTTSLLITSATAHSVRNTSIYSGMIGQQDGIEAVRQARRKLHKVKKS